MDNVLCIFNVVPASSNSRLCKRDFEFSRKLVDYRTTDFINELNHTFAGKFLKSRQNNVAAIFVSYWTGRYISHLVEVSDESAEMKLVYANDKLRSLFLKFIHEVINMFIGSIWSKFAAKASERFYMTLVWLMVACI